MNPVVSITSRDIRFGSATDAQAAAGLDVILADSITFLRRYVVLTEHQATAIVLWIAHTHALDAFDCTPYLQVTSATKRAGKTRLLEVLEPIVARPWFTGRTSAAALGRKVDAESPTLLLDESDAAFNGEKDYAEALRGQLNTGYRRSGRSTVCVGQGANITVKDFSTFSPKAIAGIGKLPDTVADRSIAIQLRRRTTDEPCERWRERDGHYQAGPMHQALSAWAGRATEVLRDARPSIPESLSDRAADCWEPLLAIADLAGGSWPTRARAAAIDLAGATDDSADINVELLNDIRQVFIASHSTFISSTDLAKQLADLDDRPWSDWKNGKPITPRAIADRLRTFGIFPGPNATRTARGYYQDRFADAWTRYPPCKVSNRPNTNENGPESHISSVQPDPRVDTSKSKKSPINTGLSDGWTLRGGGEGDAEL